MDTKQPRAARGNIIVRRCVTDAFDHISREADHNRILAIAVHTHLAPVDLRQISAGQQLRRTDRPTRRPTRYPMVF